MRSFFLTLVAVFSMLLTLPARGEDPAITTTGTATVYAVPDKAVFTVTISSDNPDITKACAKNTADAEKFVKAVKDAGIPQEDIATNTMSISIHYRRLPGNSGESERDGFTASRYYSVTLKDLKQIEKLFTAMVNSGVEALPSVDLQVSNARPYRDQARTMAVRAAQEKAAAMAKELGAAIGKPHTIVEGPTGRGYNPYYASNTSYAAVDRATPDTPESTPIGRIQIEATVTVTFELK